MHLNPAIVKRFCFIPLAVMLLVPRPGDAQSMDLGPEIQMRIDETHAAGGGIVQLEAGVYPIGNTLLLRSGVSLVGAGMGVTIVRPLVQDLDGLTVEGADVNAVIGMVAVQDVVVRDLTLDLATEGVLDNGIAIKPAGSDYAGAPSRRVTIQNVEVRAQLTVHSYMIWNMRGEQIRILDNRVDGGSIDYSSSSNQEGIESYGGHDVRIAGNDVRNVGNACIAVGSGSVATSRPRGVIVTDNHVTGCRSGIIVSASITPEFGRQDPKSILVSNNMVSSSYERGIFVMVGEGSSVDGLSLTNNIIEQTGTANGDGAGVYVQGTPEPTPDSFMSIHNNQITGTIGRQGHGIRVVEFRGADIRNNRVGDAEHSGIFLLHAAGSVVAGNRVTDVGYYAIGLHGNSDNSQVHGNVGSGWGRIRSTAALQFASSGVISDGSNYFHGMSTSPGR